MLKKIYWYLFVYDLNNPASVEMVNSHQPVRKKLLKEITFLLLLSYILLIFNSLLPVAADALAHTLWKQEHLTSVHKIKGKMHVKEEITNAAKQAEKDKTSGTEKNSEYGQHVLWIIAYSFGIFFLLDLLYSPFISGSPSSYAALAYQPPETRGLF